MIPEVFGRLDAQGGFLPASIPESPALASRPVLCADAEPALTVAAAGRGARPAHAPGLAMDEVLPRSARGHQRFLEELVSWLVWNERRTTSALPPGPRSAGARSAR